MANYDHYIRLSSSKKIYQCTDPINHLWTEIKINTLSNVYAGNYSGSNTYRSYKYVTLKDTSYMMEPVKIRHSTDSTTNWTCPSNISANCNSIGVEYTWKAALAYDSYTTLAGHIQGACPEGWHVPNTAEALWISGNIAHVSFRVDKINGNDYATKRAWISYDAERTCPAKKLNGQWITYCNYAWTWAPGQGYFDYQSHAYKTTDYFYVYCIKTN